VEDERSRVLGSSNWTGRNKDGEREGEGYIRLANTQVCQECAEIPKIDKLLLLIHRGVHIYSQTFARPSRKGLEVELDGEAGKGI